VASQGQDSDEISPLSVTNPEAQIKAAKKTMTKETTPETKPNESSQITSAQADQMILKSVSPLIKNEQAALWKSVNIDEIT
jgi:hypothetical protein